MSGLWLEPPFIHVLLPSVSRCPRLPAAPQRPRPETRYPLMYGLDIGRFCVEVVFERLGTKKVGTGGDRATEDLRLPPALGGSLRAEGALAAGDEGYAEGPGDGELGPRDASVPRVPGGAAFVFCAEAPWGTS